MSKKEKVMNVSLAPVGKIAEPDRVRIAPSIDLEHMGETKKRKTPSAQQLEEEHQVELGYP